MQWSSNPIVNLLSCTGKQRETEDDKTKMMQLDRWNLKRKNLTSSCSCIHEVITNLLTIDKSLWWNNIWQVSENCLFVHLEFASKTQSVVETDANKYYIIQVTYIYLHCGVLIMLLYLWQPPLSHHYESHAIIRNLVSAVEISMLTWSRAFYNLFSRAFS